LTTRHIYYQPHLQSMKYCYNLSSLFLGGLIVLSGCQRFLQADEHDESAVTVSYKVQKNQVLYRKVSKEEADDRKLSTIHDTVAAFTNGNNKLRAFVYKEEDEKYLYVDFNGNDRRKLGTTEEDKKQAKIKSIRIGQYSTASPDAKLKSGGDVAQSTSATGPDERSVHLLTPDDIDSTYFTNIELKPDRSYKVLHLRPFKYTFNSLVIVPLTIPLKFRFRTQGLPATVAADFNAGALVAWRHGWRKFKRAEYRKATRTSTQNRHFTLGVFSSITPVTQTPDDTEGLTTERSVAAIGPGIAAMYGFERLTLGLAGGIDIPFSNRSKWAYKDQQWLGIVVGIDLFD